MNDEILSRACAVCGTERSAENHDEGGWWAWCICGPTCTVALKAQIERRGREREPGIDGKSVTIDAEVGDEYAIARTSLQARIRDELTRPIRQTRMRRSCRDAGIAAELAPALLALAQLAGVELLWSERSIADAGYA